MRGAQHILMHRVVPPHMQGFALPHAELQEVPVRPLLQPVQVPLKSRKQYQVLLGKQGQHKCISLWENNRSFLYK